MSKAASYFDQGGVMALTKKQRAELREKFGGKCAYCGCELPEKGWHADHAEAVFRNISKGYAMDRPELDCVENMMPACQPCNLYKAACSIEQFRERVATQLDVFSCLSHYLCPSHAQSRQPSKS